MQSFLIDFLLNAYLTEHSQSIDLSRLTLPSIKPSSNAFLTLENLYQHVQQSFIPKTANRSEQVDDHQENDELFLEKINNESSQITITVCDEAKSLKRQFTCNRTLLIREMRYFADYLKDEPEQLEEVDISVHCDLDIFQWLMSFVNRHLSDKAPELEARIAVSILISSDFLKMDKLVLLSLDYIHDHMNEILGSNCNVSCIPEGIFRQLAKRFDDPLEIEQIHDRKNKIRGKLFEYNLEYLLMDMKIVRCQFCSTIMSSEQMQHLPCENDRLILQSNGKLDFQHKIDLKFDVNLWAKEIYSRCENSWRQAFWVIWLHVHGDYCARCNGYFRFIDSACCPYHPSSTITEGKYDCCSRLVSNFDILQLNNRDHGCQQHDHICQTQNRPARIFENLEKTDVIKSFSTARSPTVDSNRSETTLNKIIEQSIFGSTNAEAKKGSVQIQWTSLLDTAPCAADVKYSWDPTKSTRWNQDIQREDEHRRFDEILRSIYSIQQTNQKSQTQRTMKEPNSTPIISPGGIYCRIENEWRNRQYTPTASNKTRQRITLK